MRSIEAKRSTSAALAAKLRTMCSSLCCAQIERYRRGSFDGTFYIQSFIMVLVDGEVVNPPPLVAIAAAENDDVDRSCAADCAAALFPRPLGKRDAVTLGELQQCRAVRAVGIWPLLDQRRTVDEH